MAYLIPKDLVYTCCQVILRNHKVGFRIVPLCIFGPVLVCLLTARNAGLSYRLPVPGYCSYLLSLCS